MSIFGGKSTKKDEHDDNDDEEIIEPWRGALEALFFEALLSYYEGTPMFAESEFQTLRDELEYLGSGAVRLASVEKLWVLATQERDFDRRIKEEFDLSADELEIMKEKLKELKRPSHEGRRRSAGILVKDYPKIIGGERRLKGWRDDDGDVSGDLTNIGGGGNGVGGGLFGREAEKFDEKTKSKFAADADKVEADYAVDERLKYFLFGDAVEEKFKLALLYLPAALMAVVAASVLTMLFALLDGEMVVTISSMGRIRLGILSYCVVMGTVWFTNSATPMMLSYLDLGKPVLLKAKCPNCQGPVSCLFTSCVGRVRDERKCSTCGAIVGFNSRWSKVYLVAPPHHDKFLAPD